MLPIVPFRKFAGIQGRAGVQLKLSEIREAKNKDAEINPSRHWIQLLVRSDADLCRAVVRRLVYE